MAKKKLSSLEDLGGFVFSTNDDFELENNTASETLSANEQRLEAHFSNKGRGGKVVTVIKGFQGLEEDLKNQENELKDHEIELELEKEKREIESTKSKYIKKNDKNKNKNDSIMNLIFF